MSYLDKYKKNEQSYLEARFAIFESTLTGPNYRNFRYCGKKYYFSENVLKKSQKTSYLKNYKDLNSIF